MKFLIDTNILIPAEPTSPSDIEPATPAIAEMLRLLAEGKHQLLVHPASLEDLQRDNNETRRKMREVLFKKYAPLPSVPRMSVRLKSIIGVAAPGTRDAVDDALLASLDADAIDYLVTEDRGLRKKAGRVGLQTRVATVGEAVALIRNLFPKRPPPPPAVRSLLAYDLNESDPIFESFRRDYAPAFDTWLRNCKREQRQSWVIQQHDGMDYAGICIVKPEASGTYGLSGKVLKLCSFKISETTRGFRYGELLLKTVFSYAVANSYDNLFVTVFPKYNDLIALLEDFGFESIGQRTDREEMILAKPMRYAADSETCLTALNFHVRYGPFAVKKIGACAFIIPVMPRYHRMLFPDVEAQLELVPGQTPFGNSIRKAYLCHAVIRTIKPGSVLLFYRSRENPAVHCVGIAEATLVSSNPTELARFVGKRTVYSFEQIRQKCSKPILAILFRQSRILRNPISISELLSNGALKAAPQSIVRVPKGEMTWVCQRLDT